ncbi:MAG: hypothetical protein OEZ06_15160 [Myxococcales bacterium]|nr:hypothetical protein [Myxococcales bacterium]
MPLFRSLVVALIATAAAPTPGHAWTRSSVESARAEVTIDEAGRSHTRLQVGIRISGGWLSEFELQQLGDEVLLDAEAPPRMTDTEGHVYLPEAVAREDGRVLIRFPSKKSAPWRGRYLLELSYHSGSQSPAGIESRGRRVRWSLPAWRTDLSGVELSLRAPAGARLLSGSESDDVALRTRRRDGHVEMQLRRHQLPRTVAWQLELELPDRAVNNTHPTAATVAPMAPSALGDLWPLGLGLLLLAIKPHVARARARRRGLRPLALIPLSRNGELGADGMRRVGLGTVFAAIGLVILPQSWPAGLFASLPLVALAMTRGYVVDPASAAAGGLHRWRALTALDRQRIRKQRLDDVFGAAAWLDATTPAGLSLVASAALLVLTAPLDTTTTLEGLSALLFLLPLFFNATRLSVGPSLGQAIAGLEALRKDLDLATSLRVHSEARTAQARAVELWLQAGEGDASGLRKLAIGLAPRPPGRSAPSRRRTFAWICVCDAASPCDLALSRELPDAPRQLSRDGRRVMRVLSLKRVDIELSSLRGCLQAATAASHAQRRPVAPGQQPSEAPAPAPRPAELSAPAA